MTIEQLTDFFFWMTLINIGLLLFSTVMLILLKDVTMRMHSKLFGIEDKQVAFVAYQFLGNYKIMIIVLNLAPLLALHLMQ